MTHLLLKKSTKTSLSIQAVLKMRSLLSPCARKRTSVATPARVLPTNASACLVSMKIVLRKQDSLKALTKMNFAESVILVSSGQKLAPSSHAVMSFTQTASSNSFSTSGPLLESLSASWLALLAIRRSSLMDYQSLLPQSSVHSSA